MGTGKELVRLTHSGIWKEYVSSKPYFIMAKFFDRDSNSITEDRCNRSVFCSLTLFIKKKNVSPRYAKLLGDTLRLVASTQSESMFMRIEQTSKTYRITIV